MRAIYEYLDYSEYLLAMTKEKHGVNKGLTPRAIALQAGIDPSLFRKILLGTRIISVEHAMRLAQQFRLKPSERDYFELLVHYKRAKGASERAQLLGRILSLQKLKLKNLDKGQNSYYGRWYITVIRELLHFYHFTDYAQLAAMLTPRISAGEAEHAVALLIQLGLVAQSPDGGLRTVDQFMTPAPETSAGAIRGFQSSMIRRALEALDSVPKEQREISTITMTLSREGFGKLKERMKQFRRELLQIAAEDSNENSVYHINLHAFPVTAEYKGRGKRK